MAKPKGKFVGGGFENLLKGFAEVKNLQVIVGIVNKDKHPTKDGSSINTAIIYRVQEQGSPKNNVPPRPTLTPAIEDAKYKSRVQVAIKDLIDGNGAEIGLDRIGEVAMLKTKTNIQGIKEPPLKPATIANRVNKGTTNPLVDTKLLLKQIDRKVVRRGNDG